MDGHGQPALLYIVPCTLGKTRSLSSLSSICFRTLLSIVLKQNLMCFLSVGLAVILGLVRGELKELWNYGIEESESHTPEDPMPVA